MTGFSQGVIVVQPDLEATLSWSWLSADDLPEIAELREATDYLDDPVERVDLAHLQDLFEAPGAKPGRHGAVGRDARGSVIAYAWGHPRRGEEELRWWIDWAVHPAWRYRGIGDACLVWLKERGVEWWEEEVLSGIQSPLWMGAHIDEKLTLRVHQMERMGFRPEKWFSDMKVLFAEADPSQLPEAVPEGIRLVAFTDELSEAVRAAHNLAFSTVSGSKGISREVWDHTLQVTTMRPDWSIVALHGDEVVGYGLSSGYAAEWDAQGYTWIARLGPRTRERDEIFHGRSLQMGNHQAQEGCHRCQARQALRQAGEGCRGRGAPRWR